jgi:hypothetical protein
MILTKLFKQIVMLIIPVLFLAVGLMTITGCAGTAADLLAYDNIIAAAQQAEIGVKAYDTTVQADTAQRQTEMLKALRESILIVAKASPAASQPSGGADALADRIVAAMQQHLANYAEQERRRAALYGSTMDNLDYIIQVSQNSKAFVLYRSNIADQWKQYLQATGLSQIKPVTTQPSIAGGGAK